ncbi:MAG: efflux transporter periplasmic adaptor subunit [Burkholderiales bacterium PBB4]|nr:MAG: efflux transporter periplasmic adaptor subunit [Burkholderiales bacterium PBB4]
MIRDTSAQDQALAPSSHRLTMKHWMGLVLALLLLGLAVVAVGRWSNTSHSVSASRLRIAEVGMGNLVRDAAVNGRVVAAVSPTVYATATGSVTLKVKAGDTVHQGQVLAVIESPDVQEQYKREEASLQQLEAEVARQHILSKKQKLNAQRDAEQAQIELLTARLALERIEPAFKEGVIAKVDYLKAKDTHSSAVIRSQHADQTASLESEDVGFGLQTRQSQLQRQRIALANAQRRVDELTLKAPVSGFVGTLAVSSGTVVVANGAVMSLVDLSQLEVEVEVPEAYVVDLSVGVPAEILVGGTKVMGKLSALSPEVVKSQVLARVRFDNAPPAGLRQSQRVSARLLMEEKHDVLMVQRGPFVESEGGHFVYRIDNHHAWRVPVVLGASSLTAIEVQSGLKAGDQIVVSGSDAFLGAPTVSIQP